MSLILLSFLSTAFAWERQLGSDPMTDATSTLAILPATGEPAATLIWGCSVEPGKAPALVAFIMPDTFNRVQFTHLVGKVPFATGKVRYDALPAVGVDFMLTDSGVTAGWLPNVAAPEVRQWLTTDTLKVQIPLYGRDAVYTFAVGAKREVLRDVVQRCGVEIPAERPLPPG